MSACPCARRLYTTRAGMSQMLAEALHSVHWPARNGSWFPRIGAPTLWWTPAKLNAKPVANATRGAARDETKTTPAPSTWSGFASADAVLGLWGLQRVPKAPAAPPVELPVELSLQPPVQLAACEDRPRYRLAAWCVPGNRASSSQLQRDAPARVQPTAPAPPQAAPAAPLCCGAVDALVAD